MVVYTFCLVLMVTWPREVVNKSTGEIKNIITGISVLFDILPPLPRRGTGLLMRPKHSETNAKPETETKNYETETSLVNSVASESERNRYTL